MHKLKTNGSCLISDEMRIETTQSDDGNTIKLPTYLTFDFRLPWFLFIVYRRNHSFDLLLSCREIYLFTRNNAHSYKSNSV